MLSHLVHQIRAGSKVASVSVMVVVLVADKQTRKCAAQRSDRRPSFASAQSHKLDPILYTNIEDPVSSPAIRIWLFQKQWPIRTTPLLLCATTAWWEHEHPTVHTPT